MGLSRKVLAAAALVVGAAAVFCSGESSAAEAVGFGGPLEYKNQFPLFLGLGRPVFASARPRDAVSIAVSHSSVHMVRSSERWLSQIDMESTALDLAVTRAFYDTVEAGLAASMVSFDSGILDGPLKTYHDAFGFKDYGRSRRPKNSFIYEVSRDGTPVVSGSTGVGPADTKLWLKALVYSSGGSTSGNADTRPGPRTIGFDVAFKAELELSTGDAAAGYGNGSVDASASLLVDKRLSRRVFAYVNAGMVFPGDVRGHQTIATRDYAFGGVCLEMAATRSLALIAQFMYEGPPYPETGIDSIDRGSSTLVLGGRYKGADLDYEFGFTEDVSTSGAPDFTLTLSLKRGF